MITTIRMGERELIALQYVKNVYPISIIEKREMDYDDHEVTLTYNNAEDLIYAGMQIQRMAYPIAVKNTYSDTYTSGSYDNDRSEDYAS